MGEKLDLIWQEWQDVLCTEFENRMGAITAKQYGNFARKKFSVIFLLPEGFPCPSTEILPAVIEYFKESEINSPGDNRQLDMAAMAGHRFGMVENNADLRLYLQGALGVLKPHGQIIFTSIDQSEPKEKKNPSLSNRQFQQAKLVGPFFKLQSFKQEGWINQSAASGWRSEIIYRQDERNFCARLTL
jgi:hypothetical protein